MVLFLPVGAYCAGLCSVRGFLQRSLMTGSAAILLDVAQGYFEATVALGAWNRPSGSLIVSPSHMNRDDA